MRRFPPIRCLACLVLLAGFLESARAAQMISLDGLLDWGDPFSASVKDLEAKLPAPLPADARTQLSNGAIVVHIVKGDSADYRIFGAKMKVTEFRISEREDSSISHIHISGESAFSEIATEVERIFQSAPQKIKAWSASGETWDALSWRLPGRWVYMAERSGVTSINIVRPQTKSSPPSPTGTASAPVTAPAARADLDFLLNTSEVWKCDGVKFQTMYVAREGESQDKPPQFEWLTAAKDRARFSRRMFSDVETKLTMLGGSMKVEEATVEFVKGRVARVTISFYNRGDSGDIDPSAFEQLYKKIGQNLGQVFKVSPKSQLMSSNAAVRTVGWNWTTPQGIALLEYNDYSKGGKPEFLRLKLAAPDQADWSMGRLSVGVQRMALIKNVKRAADGDVYVAGVPMVDQGAKGYCVAASCQRLFEYMQIPCDQHEMAQLLNVDAESGANAIEMQKSLAKVDSRFNVAFKPLVNPEIYYDGKGKRRVSVKEFASTIKENSDKGVPLLWALQLGVFKEDPPLPGGGQVSGGHMRMIIGYNSTRNQILFTDSWGAGHELKRMDASEAYEVTLGLYSMSPRGL